MMFSRGSVVTPLVRPEKNLDPTREGSMFGEASSKPCSSSLCLRDFILLSGILASEGWQRWAGGERLASRLDKPLHTAWRQCHEIMYCQHQSAVTGTRKLVDLGVRVILEIICQNG